MSFSSTSPKSQVSRASFLYPALSLPISMSYIVHKNCISFCAFHAMPSSAPDVLFFSFSSLPYFPITSSSVVFFPLLLSNDVGEYVRRVGRTGRAGRPGTVTVLVHGRQVPIAKSLLGASIEGKKIEPVPELSNLESWRRSGENE